MRRREPLGPTAEFVSLPCVPISSGDDGSPDPRASAQQPMSIGTCLCQASSALNPATFRVSWLNSTATRCNGSPRWRYLSA